MNWTAIKGTPMNSSNYAIVQDNIRVMKPFLIVLMIFEVLLFIWMFYQIKQDWKEE